ncbi:DUF5615 family PIN-like protein [Roseibium sp. Sym1]|uniref:DUF5615 family PIN-like protein n=1 Tax=Roseibium sp. Sym1 TaxID=3016006 RepID=UPI0022B56D6A|nr:DUF5615 family PIN-like protein [Roseibium sp. Sym1]
MRFILDENVAVSVLNKLRELDFEAEFIRELIPEGSADPLVSFVAEDQRCVLVSHDGDFQKIAPRIPDGQKQRFRKLSRIKLNCDEFKAAKRIEQTIDFIQSEYQVAQSKRDKRMILQIGKSYVRSDR